MSDAFELDHCGHIVQSEKFTISIKYLDAIAIDADY